MTKVGCHKHTMCFLPSQERHCTERTIEFDIKRIGNKCLILPQRTNAEPLYLSYQRGGLNHLPINVVADISQSAHLGQLSMAFLKSVEKKRIRRPPEPQPTTRVVVWRGPSQMSTQIYEIYGLVFGPRRKTNSSVSWVNDDYKMTPCLNGFMLRRGVA